MLRLIARENIFIHYMYKCNTQNIRRTDLHT